MGKYIEQTQFSAQDFTEFRNRLNENLKALQLLLSQPDFGRGVPSFGAELEVYIIDAQGAAKPINMELQQLINDEQLTLELNRFNLEYNFNPVGQEKAPFSRMCKQMTDVLFGLDEAAKTYQARILPIGILPTLKASDMGLKALTDIPRYHILANSLINKRGADFHIHIDGEDAVDFHWQDVTLEGAATSFQFHYRVDPENFADTYNAAQLTTPLVLALSANSPFFLGRKLWQETRIALFKQATDCRIQEALDNHLPARVFFGFGWIRKDIYEMFAEAVHLFEPLIPVCSNCDPFVQMRAGQPPSLSELRLHMGTIWNWNRPIYDPHDNGHLRIELRSLPAGPTSSNMLASAALMSGLMSGLHSRLSDILPGLPFRYAENNFYRAAKNGLQAHLFWPDFKSGRIRERSVISILKELLPLAEEGLGLLGVGDSEITAQMKIINGGLESQINGAQWQINMFDQLIKKEDRKTALTQLVENYHREYQTGKAVHEWSDKI
ncbi:glutamate-cysteine ligase family protein [Psychromonas sp.]|uniref:glutamate-cysteine ligase family protein n=1 Tax=Psychromonas sp. TaxID=1884585 RepID=UPI0035671781